MAKINLGKVVPEKGVDYFTEEEIAEFKAAIEADVDTRLDTDEANITTNANNISDNTSAISALGTRMTTAEGNISTNAGNITSIGNRVTTLESDMTTAKSNIQTNAGDIDTLEQQQTIQDNAIAANTTALEGLANIPGKVTALETNDAAQDMEIINLKEENESLIKTINNTTLDSTDTPSDNITLQDTGEGARLKKFVIDGKTEQFSTTGKNLLPISTKSSASNGINSTANADGTLTVSGTTTSNYFLMCNTLNVSIPAGTYTFSLQNAIGFPIRLDLTYTDDTTENTFSINSGSTSRTIALSKSIKQIMIECSTITSGTQINELLKLQLEAGSEATSWEPYTGGIPSPNPNYSQEIKNVEGINIASLKTSTTKTIGGVPFTIQDGIININGAPNGYNSFYFDSFQSNSGSAMFWIEVTGYTDKTSGNSSIILEQSDDNSTWSIAREISLLSTAGKQYSVTLDNTKYYRIRWYYNTNTFTNATIKVQLEYGTAKSDFVPYGCIGIKKCNINLIGFGTVLNGYVDTTTSKFTTSNVAAKASVGYYFKTKDLPDTITFKTTGGNRANVNYFNQIPANDIVASLKSASNNNPRTIQVNKDYPYMHIQFSYNDTNVSNIMINEGSTALNYIQPQTKTYNFPLSEGQVLMQNGSIENKVVNTQNQIVLDGVTTGRKVNTVGQNSSTGLYYCQCNNVFTDGTPVSSYNVDNLLCTHFKAVSGVAIGQCYRTGTNGVILVFILTDQTITTAEQANTWLAQELTNGTPVKVEYPLATPDETAFTPEQQAVIDEIIKDGTYDEVTYYSSIASINPDIEAVGIKDIRKVIENLDARLTLVEE